jgi:hypothetical protein
VLAFPTGYHGDYFYADYCGGWIRRIDPVTGTDAAFAGGIGFPVDLKVGPDGALYYLARRRWSRGRISYSAADPPAITLPPADRTVAVGTSATFTVSATGAAPLTYRWRRNGNLITGATGTSYTLANAQLGDSGALFDVIVSNDFGSATSDNRAADCHAEHGARCCDYAARRRDHLRGRVRDQLRRHSATMRKTACCPPAPSHGGSTFTTPIAPINASAHGTR